MRSGNFRSAPEIACCPFCVSCGVQARVREHNCPSQAGMRPALPVVILHDVKQPAPPPSATQHISFPRRICAPGFSLFLSRPSPWRGGRSADRRTISFVAFARRDGSARVRRGASHDAGRSPLGAPPWRFSAGGRASISGISSGSVQRCSSQPGRHAWRAVSRTSRARGYEPRPQDATPRSVFQDRLRKTPLHERGWESLYYKFIT